jgi:type II secretory pathway component PulM
LSAGILACLILLLAVPEASRGARELCNRLFSASEAVNSYVYRRFVVPENQSVLLASVLLLCAALLLLVLTVILRSRPAAFGIMAACVLFQVYFGLPFPAWVNILLCALSSLWMLRYPPGRKALAACCALFLLVSLLVVLFLPGVDAATESTSETLRDHLTRLAEQLAGAVSETPGRETETRRIHTRSLDEGDRAAETMQEFRLLSVEEEQVSMPRWIDWMKTVLLFLLAIVLVTLPFAPFLLLNARKKKARKMREPFASGNVNEAVQAVFRSIILWLEATDHGAGNLLYRDWSTRLPDDLLKSSADYSARFSRCAADYEEAVYSDHPLPEQKRREALDLLRETEAVLWKAADRKTRFRLKYRLCLVE